MKKKIWSYIVVTLGALAAFSGGIGIGWLGADWPGRKVTLLITVVITVGLGFLIAGQLPARHGGLLTDRRSFVQNTVPVIVLLLVIAVMVWLLWRVW